MTLPAATEIVVIDGVTIRYRTAPGEGSPIVFVHGVYVGGSLWAPLVDRLAGRHCIVPTWPHGAHRDPAPDADLSARAATARILGFLEALDLHDVTLVGNDTGGGLCLAALGSEHPGVARIGRLVLTNGDSYEHFPPKEFTTVVKIARRVPPLGRVVVRLFATRPGRRFFLKQVCARPPADADGIFEAFATSAATRRDAVRFTASLEPSLTLDAAAAISRFDRPVLIAWGTSDTMFPVAHAQRLADDFPSAELQLIADADTYVMLDRPDELAAAIAAFSDRSAAK